MTVYKQFKTIGETFINLLTEYEKAWMPNEEIDSREKGEAYSNKMEKLSKEINCARDHMEAEYRLYGVYQMERQSDALESIAESLKALLALKVQ